MRDATAFPVRTFTYDADARASTAWRGTWHASFLYGPGGGVARTDVWNGTTLSRRIWQLGDLVEERTRADGHTEVDRRVVGPLGLIATLRTDAGTRQTVYVHGDGRANRLFTRADGATAQDVRYRAFGSVLSDTATTPSLTASDDLWNGGDDLRELGVDLLGARLYDPALGRFLQRDPLVAGASSSAAHPYAFAFDDPVNFADPSGLSACESPTPCDLATAAIGGAIGFGMWAMWQGRGHAETDSVLDIDMDEAISDAEQWVGEQWLSINGSLGRGLGRGIVDMGKGLIARGKRCLASYVDCALADGEALERGAELQVSGIYDPPGTLRGLGRGDVFEGIGYYAAPAVAGELGGIAINMALRIGVRSVGASTATSPRFIEMSADELAETRGGAPSGSYGELRAAGFKDAHHVIQDAAVRDLPGYSRGAAPAVELPGPSTKVGSPHYEATQVQRQAGGGTYAAERRIGYKALRRAGLTPEAARVQIGLADAYFDSIGVTRPTVTRIPGNR